MRAYPDLSDFEASSRVLKNAVAAGIVEFDFSWLSSNVTVAAIEFAEKTFSGSNTAEISEIGRSPRSLHYRENTRGEMVHPDDEDFRPWIVEVARFRVPRGNVGVVKGIDQFLSHVTLQGETIHSLSPVWGDPFTSLSAPGEWHFRLSNINRFPTPWFDATNLQRLPGYPYPDLPVSRGLWWPAGSSSAQNLHLLIPEERLFRVFYVNDAPDVRIHVGALIRGYIQSSMSLQAISNIRSNW